MKKKTSPLSIKKIGLFMTNFNGVNSTNNLVSYLDRGRGTELKYGISINKKLKFERLLKSRLRPGKLK